MLCCDVMCRSVFAEHSLSADIASTLSTLYDQHRASILAHLETTGRHSRYYPAKPMRNQSMSERAETTSWLVLVTLIFTHSPDLLPRMTLTLFIFISPLATLI